MLVRVTLIVLIALIALQSAYLFGAGHTLQPQEQKVLERWLQKYPDLRVATEADCDCVESIQRMKAGSGGVWKPVPDYNPYVATGDFNGDGVRDFAVVVVIKSKTKDNFTLAVFNGPVAEKSDAPAFYQPNLDLRHQGLFFGLPRPKPYRLVVGPFESDNARILVPKGTSYDWKLNITF
jgi:hypothetical protein